MPPSKKFIIKINAGELVPKSSARVFYLLAIFIIFFQTLTIVWLWNKLPRVVPIFFTQPWGEARLAPKLYLALFPGLSLVIGIINLVLSRGAKDESPLLPYTLAVATMVVTAMLAIGLGGILQSIL